MIPEHTPKLGVGCLVVRDTEVLLIRRKGSHGAGTWSTPGGHLDYGESPLACAARETHEETGVTVRNIRFVGITNDLFPAERKHYVTLWVVAEYASGEAVMRDAREMDAFQWCAADALPANLFVPLENLVHGRTEPPEVTLPVRLAIA